MIIIESNDMQLREVADSWRSARVLMKGIRDWLYRNGFKYFNESPIYDGEGNMESRILSAQRGERFIEVVATRM